LASFVVGCHIVSTAVTKAMITSFRVVTNLIASSLIVKTLIDICHTHTVGLLHNNIDVKKAFPIF